MASSPDANPTPPSNADPSKTLGRRLLFDRSEFIRLIISSLYSLGYRRTACSLELESGIPLDSPEYVSLLFYILSSRWNDCVSVIGSIGGLDSGTRSLATFLAWREHFMELLGSGDGVLPAIGVLQKRISQLELDRRRVHGLARAIVTLEGAVTVENTVRSRVGLLMDLVEVLPPWVRVPSGRLEHLVESAVVKQVESCVYHNSREEITLYMDHECSREQIPCKCSQILCAHKNEVWFVQFSNNGEYLASSSSDCTAIIWKVDEDDTLSVKYTLEGHTKPVSFVAWSPDDSMLLTCGNGEVLKLWDANTGKCRHTFASSIKRIVNSCAWFPDSKRIVCGSIDPDNRIYTCDLEGNELEVWEGERMPKISDIAVTPDGHFLISICSNREIWIREFPRGKEWVIEEEHSITSLSLSRDGKSLIVNLNSEEIHLWNVLGCSNTPVRFTGHKQNKYVIRSCFGGLNSSFIASGSENSQIYIWQRHHEMPIEVLSGHLMTVNCVSWNSIRTHMLASASDDRTVRIWIGNRSERTNFE
ncbi:Notchless protein like [Apostasia shenzhenica]|uniref:Notchless protein like n=1 Tax=Apostasia shenzhenica TaxID=1088818 RepID=A0A2I0A977_9ASPA|nr:Notchless protein like [Apostasia shenzhenica]